MKSGAKPTRIDHRDYDFLKSHKLGGISAPAFPAELLTDAGFWMPNQDTSNTLPGSDTVIPPLPEGCTDFCQADISTDIDLLLKNPEIIEAVDHANASGGIDIRTALKAAVSLGWITTYYNIQSSSLIDSFDSIRMAAFIGQPEKRSVSWGTPWFPSWEQAALAGQSLMPMPTPQELQTIAQNINAYPWHNSKLAVWQTNNGSPVLRNKSWQGTNIGDNGWLYFPREVVNVVMGINGTVAYTGTKQTAQNPVSIDVSVIQFIVSFFNNLFNIP